MENRIDEHWEDINALIDQVGDATLRGKIQGLIDATLSDQLVLLNVLVESPKNVSELILDNFEFASSVKQLQTSCENNALSSEIDGIGPARERDVLRLIDRGLGAVTAVDNPVSATPFSDATEEQKRSMILSSFDALVGGPDWRRKDNKDYIRRDKLQTSVIGESPSPEGDWREKSLIPFNRISRALFGPRVVIDRKTYVCKKA